MLVRICVEKEESKTVCSQELAVMKQRDRQRQRWRDNIEDNQQKYGIIKGQGKVKEIGCSVSVSKKLSFLRN